MIDNVGGGEMATDHLLKLGQRFLFIGNHEFQTAPINKPRFPMMKSHNDFSISLRLLLNHKDNGGFAKDSDMLLFCFRYFFENLN